MFFKDFGRGISSHIDAIKFAWKHKLGIYFLIPLMLSLILFYAGIFSVWHIGTIAREKAVDLIMPYIAPAAEGSDGSWLVSGLLEIFGLFVQGFVGMILIFLLLKFIRYIILILISPVLALLSERVDEILTGKKNPFIFKQFLKDMLRGILVSLRNMSIETGLILLTFFLAFIPVLNIFAVPAGAILSWYFLGFNMMDYTYERRRMSISKGAQFTRKHKGIAIGNGLVYSVLLFIPVIGFSFGPVLSAIAATIATTEKLDGK